MAEAKKQSAQQLARRRLVKRRYVNSLDGLRSLAVLAVVAYHMRLSWMGGGLIGVTMLFVLSGYLMTAGLMREYSQSKGHLELGSIYLRRVTRLLPTVVVFICVIGAVCALANHVLFTKMRGDIIPALFMVINWTKIFFQESYFAAAGAPSPLTHFWSLAIEMQFSLLWPLAFFLIMKKHPKKRTVTIGLIIMSILSAALMAFLYVPGQDPTRAYYGTDTRLQSLTLGCVLGIVWPLDRTSRRNASDASPAGGFICNILGPLAIVGLIVMMVMTEGYGPFSYYGGIFLASLLTLAAVAALVPKDTFISKVLGCAPLAWLGKRGYAIYIWHYPILELMNPLNSTSAPSPVKLLIELAIIIVVADISYRLVERPLRSPDNFKLAFVEAAEKSAERAGESIRFFLPPSIGAIPSWVPATAIAGVTGVIMCFGLFTVDPVTVAGDNPNDQVVVQASLKKPVVDGVYDVVVIGDSVALGANDQLNTVFPHGLIDVRGERQLDEAVEVLKDYIAENVVGDDVVLSIGTNGVLEEKLLDEVLASIGPKRRLWLVNLRSPNSKDIDNNELIERYAAEHDNVKVIDWYGATENHENYLIEDGIHLTWDGRDAFAKLIVDTMEYVAPSKENTTYDVVIMGDTVCLNAANDLAKAYPQGCIDTAEGRSLSDTLKVFKGYADSGVVGSAVVLATGNESAIVETDLEAFVNAVGSTRRLWIVNTRTPNTFCQENNKIFEHVASTHSNVFVIDWFASSEAHGEYLEDDGVHLSKDGVVAYSNLIFSSVDTKRLGEASAEAAAAAAEAKAKESSDDTEAEEGVTDSSTTGEETTSEEGTNESSTSTTTAESDGTTSTDTDSTTSDTSDYSSDGSDYSDSGDYSTDNSGDYGYDDYSYEYTNDDGSSYEYTYDDSGYGYDEYSEYDEYAA